MTTTIQVRPTPRPALLRVLANETLEELLAVLREPTTLFFSVAMPVGFFTLFLTLWGADRTGETTVATTMLATFGTFGVVGVALITPGVGVAEDRERGWLRAKRVSATPVGATLTAKVLACLPHALGVLVAMTVIGAVGGQLDIDAPTWLRLVAVLTLGSLPFALLGLAVGFHASPNAATAILMAIYIPSAIASGLWMPIDMLPAAMQALAPWLPTYHLSQLALAQLDGGLGVTHAIVLLGFTTLATAAATLAYRRQRP